MWIRPLALAARPVCLVRPFFKQPEIQFFTKLWLQQLFDRAEKQIFRVEFFKVRTKGDVRGTKVHLKNWSPNLAKKTSKFDFCRLKKRGSSITFLRQCCWPKWKNGGGLDNSHGFDSFRFSSCAKTCTAKYFGKPN